MTRLIPKVMLFMMVVSLLFIATAAANALAPMHYQSKIDESSIAPNSPKFLPKPHFDDYYDYVIERIQSRLRNPVPSVAQINIGNSSRLRNEYPVPSVAQIISGNFPGLTDGYPDRQDLINDFRTRV